MTKSNSKNHSCCWRGRYAIPKLTIIWSPGRKNRYDQTI